MTDSTQTAQQDPQSGTAFSILLAASTLTWWGLLSWAFAPTTGYGVVALPFLALIAFALGVAIALGVGAALGDKGSAVAGLVLGIPLALLIFSITSQFQRGAQNHSEQERQSQIASTLLALVRAGEDDRSPPPKLPPAVTMPDLFREVADRMYPSANYYDGFPYGPELSFDQWLLAARGAMRLDVSVAHKKQAMYQVLTPLVGEFRRKSATPAQAIEWFSLWEQSFPNDTALTMKDSLGFSSDRYGYILGDDTRLAWTFVGHPTWINAWLASKLRVSGEELAVFFEAVRRDDAYGKLDTQSYRRLAERADHLTFVARQ